MIWEFIKIICLFIGILVPLLLSIAYFTVVERQGMAAMQRRQGPNVVGVYGLLQAIADGLKLFLKESITPKSANGMIFVNAPIFTFGLALAAGIIVPTLSSGGLADFPLSMLYLFAISSLSVHSIIMAGGSSNSKYAFLGGLRSAAQMISYEVPFGTVILALSIVTGSFNFSTIVEQQQYVSLGLPLLPLFVLFFICALAETNRHPFDLPEAEAELVSGYNVEYSGLGFALFFLAEYSNIILMSMILAICFCGGGYGFFGIIPEGFVLSLKTVFFMFLFVVIRAILPRYRYDQLMRLGGKIILPISLACLLIYASILMSFNGFIIINKVI